MTEHEALESRHSVRKYSARQLDKTDVDRIEAEIARLNDEGRLHMQLVLNEPTAFKSFLSYGVFSNVSNYIMVIGKKSDSLDYRAGYYSEKLILYAKSIGLDTCCVGLTYKKVKGAFTLGPNEKIVMCIAIGYGADNGYRTHKIKRPDQVSNITPESPQWFADGVNAALLAPTAVNQQKFYFEYLPDGRVKPSKGSSMVGYTKIDLGIAMYNFEVGAGKNNFEWADSPL